MPEPIVIALSQLVLWYDASRLQTWPAFLANVPEGLALSSPTDFGRRYYSDRMTDDRHSAAEKITRNLPGLEYKPKNLLLRGVGLLEQSDKGYRISDIGKNLVKTYQECPLGQEWVQMLAKILILREPRSRTLIGALSEAQAELEFTGDGWFSGSVRKAAIRRPGMPDFYPFFDGKQNYRSLRQEIDEKSWWALGDWRENILLSGYENCRFVGQLGDTFSMHDIGLALRSACEVFLQAGLFQIVDSVCTLKPGAAAELFGDDMPEGFEWETEKKDAPDLITLLRPLLEDLKDHVGFVVASELRDQLKMRGIKNPDKSLAELEEKGHLVLVSNDYGQSRHGTGLHGDPRKQLVKLRLITEENLS